MPSQCVDTPPATRRRMRTERWVEPAELFATDNLSVADLWPSTLESLKAPSAAVSGSLPLPLPMPGVVDTRPPGLRVIDVRDSVVAAGRLTPELLNSPSAHDGVVDNRPTPWFVQPQHEATGEIAVPASPFEAQMMAGALPMSVGDAVAQMVAESLETEADAASPEAVEPPVASRRKQAASPYMRRSDLRRLESKASRRTNGNTLSLPQVGIASALGLATIAAPLTGSLTAPVKAGANAFSQSTVSTAMTNSLVVKAAPADLAAPFPQVNAPLNAVEEVRVVVDDGQLTSIPAALAAPGHVLARTAHGGSTQAVLPGCDGQVPSSIKSASNGELPNAALCTLWIKKERVRADAAIDLAILNVAYRRQFGKDLCVLDGYRTLTEQYAVKRLRGGYAAAPGTSEHGWGLAIDVCGGGSLAGTPTYKWLRANADKYGWHNPDWAQPGGGGPIEPWHWEYFKGQDHASGGD